MKERTRIAEILRSFADQVEDSKKLDKYKGLELASIYVWGTFQNGIQAPAIIRKSEIDNQNISVPEVEDISNG